MSESKNLPWLDRLHIHIANYAGYQRQNERRGADQAIRDAIAQRFGTAETNLGQTIEHCHNRHADREVGALQILQEEIRRLTNRVRQAGCPEEFFRAAEFGDAKADALHALDHALLDCTDTIVEATRHSTIDHDWLAQLKGHLETFERKLDARALLFQHLP